MKRGSKIALSVVGVLTIGGGVVVARVLGSDGSADIRTVDVVRDSIVKKALAIGNIVPDIEIDIKSQVSGVVGRLMVEEGEYVEAGEPILEVMPNPTPIELADAKRHWASVSGRTNDSRCRQKDRLHILP